MMRRHGKTDNRRDAFPTPLFSDLAISQEAPCSPHRLGFITDAAVKRLADRAAEGGGAVLVPAALWVVEFAALWRHKL
jgi:hypothetical protein